MVPGGFFETERIAIRLSSKTAVRQNKEKDHTRERWGRWLGRGATVSELVHIHCFLTRA